jgi:hypothetical protein
MEQTWKDIEGTDGRYSVSDDGQIRANWSDVPRRNLKTRVRIEKQKLLRAWVHTTGYLRVSLGRNNYLYVHRLVALAFLDNPDRLPQVDHIDGNRLNNHVTNLRWVTAKQNVLAGGERHNWDTQRQASEERRIHIHRRALYQSLRDQGYSYRHIGRLFNTSHSAIKKACE